MIPFKPLRVALIFNAPVPSLYDARGESRAETGVMDAVACVGQALTSLGHDWISYPLLPPVGRAGKTLASIEADIVFNLFEGFAGMPGTEAEVAASLEALIIPFTGSPSAALALTLDKSDAAAVLRQAGVPTPIQQLCDGTDFSDFSLDFPCIVKPRSDDASHGLSETSVVFDLPALKAEVKSMVERYDGSPALVEEFLPGREFNATVFGAASREVLPISEILYTLPQGLPPILTFAAKWEPQSAYFQNTSVKCPAEIDPLLDAALRKTALAASAAAGCRGYARVDMRLDASGRPVVIEVNANPDLAPDAGMTRQAGAAGLSYQSMVEKIIGFALEVR
ncbi:D-alanine--D-alanine ligase family protein [Dehalogenimonas alkenigignens]|uniref:D-alanine-D-alanine ligase or related ATP-grasp enzyme n=1 Tax=Dehalogenimonas alkenigignens TaxID=1217799 RepID=A0A0W0GIJ1_9CHLR|nr:hypothetical protein [Dehalogenimonas alkenigignens]KTB48399.1 D-alanine-D-alanine ligase or related ATP-grasp enzyme [Dehalogenimonas alkenigignens]PVV85143.1 hypothetical protein DD509_02330 [Dehalogenimonas alkenigignens]